MYNVVDVGSRGDGGEFGRRDSIVFSVVDVGFRIFVLKKRLMPKVFDNSFVNRSISHKKDVVFEIYSFERS